MKKIKTFIPIGLLFTPALAFAATDFDSLVTLIISMLNQVIKVLVAVAVVIFLYGVVKYVVSGGDEEKKSAARNTIIYGVIGLFVMVSVWGLVGILSNTFNLQTNTPPIPTIIQ